MSLTSGWDFFTSTGIRYILGRCSQLFSGSHDRWQNNALPHCVLICLREALQALSPKVSLYLGDDPLA